MPKRQRESYSLRTFQNSVLAVILIVLFGSLGFYILETVILNHPSGPKDLLESLYFIITTISTTGYGDIIPHTPSSRLFIIIFTTVGLLTVTWAGAHAVAFVVEGHLSEHVKEKKMEKRIASLNDHYIICCLGRVGREVLREFRSQKQHDYVVIEKSKDIIDEILDIDELYITGDATEDEILKRANIENAKGLISCCPSDSDNVFTILTAKGLNPNLFVITRGQNENSRTKLIQAGANRVVMPSHLGGARIAAMALRPVIIDFLDQTLFVSKDKEPFLLEDIPIEKGNPFVGHQLKNTNIKSETEVMVIGIRKPEGEFILNPSSNYSIMEGDILVGLGQHSNFNLLRRMMNLEET